VEELHPMNPSLGDEIHLLDYLKVLTKRRWIALAFAAVVVGLAAVYAFTATPVFEGTAQLLVDTEKNQSLDFAQGEAVIQKRDPAEYFNSQKGIMRSRLFIDRVARKLQLDKNPYFIEEKARYLQEQSGGLHALGKGIARLFPERGKATPAVVDPNLPAELDPVLTDLILENLSADAPPQNNIMAVKYTATNPGVAAFMANGITSALIEYNLGLRVKPYQDAAEWLSARLVESKAKVEESEKTLQKYREGKGVVSFESKESVITQQLQELVTQLVQTENRKQEAEVRYNQILSVVNSPESLASVPEIMNNIVVQGLRKDELDLKKQVSELSQKFGPRHPQMIRLNSQLEMVQANIISEARKMLSTAKTELDVARNREASLRKTLEGQKQDVLDLSRNAIEFNVIAGESASNRQFYDLLLKKLQEASLSGGINVSNLQVVDFAVPPKDPVKPRRGMLLVLAGLVGIFGGVFLAFFVEYLDDSIKGEADVGKYLKLPLLDTVPLAPALGGGLLMDSEPNSPAAESFRTIRTGVQLSSIDKPPQVILVTSSVPDEGKTTLSTNLAAAMANGEERVLIVDTDLRRHNLHEGFGFEPAPGLTEVLQDLDAAERHIRTVSGHPQLFVLTGGNLAPNPSELLGSNRMKKFLDFARQRFDRIILDAPPLLLFSDSLILSQLSDGVILVAWGGSTSRRLVQKSVEALQGVKAKMLGVVLNKIDPARQNDYYSRDYTYFYSDRKGKHKKRT
jgi:capsular exopolysaccharide synthesis family protein